MHSVLITGAAKRVGAHLARSLHARGCKLVLHYHQSQAEAESLAHELQAELVQGNLADSASWEHIIAQAQEKLPSLNALINNASIFDRAEFQESDYALYQQEMRLNAEAPIFLTQAFAKIVGQGAVINFCDSNIVRALPSHFFYNLSKKTLAEFTKMAAVALGPKIRVNAICPGYLLPSPGFDGKYQASLEKCLPTGHIATLDDIAEGVYSLLANPAITGQLLFVDGGEHLL